MNPPRNPPQPQQVLHSPVLYKGSIRVSDRHAAGGRRRLSGTRMKAMAFPMLHRLIRYLPVPLAMLPVRLAGLMTLLLYVVPGNRLRLACKAVCELAGRAGHTHRPLRVYRRFVSNAIGTLDNFFRLYRHGGEQVLPRISMSVQDAAELQTLIDRHNGIVLAVAHNLGSAFSALHIGHHFDMLLVAKNPSSIERTRIALDFYRHMNLSLLMIRGGNAHEIARALFTALRQGKLIAATLDNIDRSQAKQTVTMFDQDVDLAVWAAKIAARTQVPVVPAWFSSRGNRIHISIGEAAIGSDIPDTVQHYAHFFEQRILDDPASWAYLADKHWQDVLAAAVRDPGGCA